MEGSARWGHPASRTKGTTTHLWTHGGPAGGQQAVREADSEFFISEAVNSPALMMAWLQGDRAPAHLGISFHISSVYFWHMEGG